MPYNFERAGFTTLGLQRVTIHWFRLANKDLIESRPLPHLFAIVNTKTNQWVANNAQTKQSHTGRCEIPEESKKQVIKHLMLIA